MLSALLMMLLGGFACASTLAADLSNRPNGPILTYLFPRIDLCSRGPRRAISIKTDFATSTLRASALMTFGNLAICSNSATGAASLTDHLSHLLLRVGVGFHEARKRVGLIDGM